VLSTGYKRLAVAPVKGVPIVHTSPTASTEPCSIKSRSTAPIKQQLARFNRLDLLGQPTALEKLERLSTWLGAMSTSNAMT
jgi:D-cysteine desulfhydrase